eukprot:scaffold1154_cov132-Amphora_coffeaeformis.AAC.4
MKLCGCGKYHQCHRKTNIRKATKKGVKGHHHGSYFTILVISFHVLGKRGGGCVTTTTTTSTTIIIIVVVVVVILQYGYQVFWWWWRCRSMLGWQTGDARGVVVVLLVGMTKMFETTQKMPNGYTRPRVVYAGMMAWYRAIQKRPGHGRPRREFLHSPNVRYIGFRCIPSHGSCW